MNMESLYTAFQHHRPAFEVLDVVVAGDHINADDRNKNWLMGIMRVVTHELLEWRPFSKSCTRCSMQNLSKECNNLQRIMKQRLVLMKKQLRNVLLAGFVNI
ncbi:unnamed protein product [Peronospora destructor]|uniref:Uncharacterized protein n=1 Tax=Peronospora destructor TaxID=86335 RepID=A0AAV0SU33_9STRA|nr:unnamed protein product [Peronospora destructor]